MENFGRSSELKTEICVIGGGPAGATIARRLAQLGHEVCLLEREIFPRSHIGESLSPGILPLFDALGIREQIEQAGFYRPLQAFVRWSGRNIQTKEFIGEPGFQVERGQFDQIMLRTAQEVGVSIIQPARAGRASRTKEGKWRIPVVTNKEQLKISADFLVDAAGRNSVLGGKKNRLSPAMIAIYAYWRNVKISGVESRVEAGEQEWFWGALLPDGTINAAVFLDPKRFRCEKVKSNNLPDFYFVLLGQSELLQDCLKGQLASRVQVCDASSYLSEDFVTPHSIKVGEAGYSIDPLSSQGVQTAIRSGLQGSVVVHTILSKPENKAAAIQFYQERESESAHYHQHQATKFYAEAGRFRVSDFWRKRAGLEIDSLKTVLEAEKLDIDISQLLSSTNRFKFSSEVKLLLTPCLLGDIIQEVPAIVHHSLDRPVAFLGGVPVSILWNLFSSMKTIPDILKEGEFYLHREKLLKIVSWMMNRNIFVSSNEI